MYENSAENILVLCYTNHALDQFLEDILDIDVPSDVMLRLGSKSTPRTKSLGLYDQAGAYRRSQQAWDLLKTNLVRTNLLENDIQKKSSSFENLRVSAKDVLEYLQFADEDPEFFLAFSIPESDDEMSQVDEKGKTVGPLYLFSRWLGGLDAGVFKNQVRAEHEHIWKMNRTQRSQCYQTWTRGFYEEHAFMLQDLMKDYDRCNEQLTEIRNENLAQVIQQKRIIGCTTNAAARHKEILMNAKPGIILVEEAGEILESHILTALSSRTKQLVLVGDHQQLRPKVNNYGLTVEKGDGYVFQFPPLLVLRTNCADNTKQVRPQQIFIRASCYKWLSAHYSCKATPHDSRHISSSKASDVPWSS